MMKGIITFIGQYKYIIVPFLVWFAIQLFKFVYDLIKTKKINFKRILQAGGMPSSHSAVVVALTTMVAKDLGVQSPEFGIALIFSFVVMYDAAGVRRAAGKQAKLLNKIVQTPGLSRSRSSRKVSRSFRTHTCASICRSTYWLNCWLNCRLGKCRVGEVSLSDKLSH